MDGKRYPHLKGVALMFFSLATSTSSSERSFSNQGFVHSKLRNKRQDNRVQKLLYCYQNLLQLEKKEQFSGPPEEEEDEFEYVDSPETNEEFD